MEPPGDGELHNKFRCSSSLGHGEAAELSPCFQRGCRFIAFPADPCISLEFRKGEGTSFPPAPFFSTSVSFPPIIGKGKRKAQEEIGSVWRGGRKKNEERE